MDKQAATDHILPRLQAGHARAEIVDELSRTLKAPPVVVELICNQTGWHWNKSQRFVGRVHTRRDDDLQSGKNRVMMAKGMVYALGATITGIGMIVGGSFGIARTLSDR